MLLTQSFRRLLAQSFRMLLAESFRMILAQPFRRLLAQSFRMLVWERSRNSGAYAPEYRSLRISRLARTPKHTGPQAKSEINEAVLESQKADRSSRGFSIIDNTWRNQHKQMNPCGRRDQLTTTDTRSHTLGSRRPLLTRLAVKRPEQARAAITQVLSCDDG